MGELNLELLRDGAAYADTWVSYQQERREIPGVVVAIRYQDELLLSSAYGYADLDRQIAMTPRHIFRVASHSKTFTATAIMQLVERGALRLDDRLADSIPWLRDVQGLASLTVRQALNHTTGIVRDGDDADYWQLDYPFPDDAELRRLVETGGLVLAANESFKYSNVAYALLGLVVQATAGMPYNEYVRRHIVERLELADTGPEIDDHARTRLATGYTARRFGLPRRPLPHADTRAFSPATGFYATAEDLCRYAAAHFFGDERLLSDASRREMQQPYWHPEQSEVHYGLGFVISQSGERRMVGHSGGFPGYITLTLFDPKDRLVVVALTNDSAGPADLLARGVLKILEYAIGQPSAAGQDSAIRYERFTGRFVSGSGITDVVAFGDTLVALTPEADNPVQFVSRLKIDDDQTLRIVTDSGFGAPGERIRYSRDADGRVTKIVLGGVSAYPLDIFRERALRG